MVYNQGSELLHALNELKYDGRRAELPLLQGPDRVEGCEWVDPPGAYCEEFEDGSGDGGSGGGGGSSTECPDDFDPSQPCTEGDKCTTGGRWYVCEGGEWVMYYRNIHFGSPRHNQVANKTVPPKWASAVKVAHAHRLGHFRRGHNGR